MPIQQVDRIVRVTWIHALYIDSAKVEVAECGVTYRAASIPSAPSTLDAVLQDMANAAAGAVHANVPTGRWRHNVTLDGVRVALEGTDGKTIAEKYAEMDETNGWQGTANADCMPWQTSLCVSLYAYQPGTFVPGSKSQRGRFYTPPPATNIAGNADSAEPDIGTVQSIVSGWGEVLAQLQAHNYSGYPAFAPVLVVNSRTKVAAYPVNWLRADNKLDTQRRRTNKMPAIVTMAAYPQ